MQTKTFISTISLVLALGLSTALAQDHQHMNMTAAAPARKAICVLYATQGNTVSGTVIFTRLPEGVRVVADLNGLTPGKHGFHIHEFGDCSSPDGSSAGGHFNPSGSPHGSPMDMSRHAGDMGNIEADANGKAHMEYIDPHMSFDGPASILGRSVIVHAKEDDMKTQPTGNAGPRIACGVIGLSKAQ
ncbi:MAG: superoxide dismutase family protein [Bacteroidetes bacterium]|nr:superoxide dismutase family protein [Bacteroidota bacterium]